MSDRVKVWISKSLVARSAQAMQELAVYRRGIINAVPKEQKDGEADGFADLAIRQLEHDAYELKSYGEFDQRHTPTEDEQITAMEQLVKELEQEGLQRFTHYGNPLDNLRGMFREAMQQRQKAFEAWAALVDNQRVNVRMITKMVEAALQQDTHKRKDIRLYVTLDIIESVLGELLAIDADNPGHYETWDDRREGPWEMRKLIREKHVLALRVKALEALVPPKEIKPDGTSVNTDEDGGNDDDIAF